MRAARLDRRASFQAPTETKGTDGGLTTTYATQFTVWGGLEAAGGRELFESGKITAEYSHKLTIRFRRGILPSWRVLIPNGATPSVNRTYAVVSALDPDDGRREMQIALKEMPDGELS
jgi:SPP1 family predicted phage head-tail adaptor